MSNKNKNKAPAMPKLDTSKLPVTDPRRKLTKTERKAMTKDEKRARRTALAASRPPAKQRAHKLMTKFVERLSRVVNRFYPADGDTADMREALDAAQATLSKISEDTMSLPDSWSPKGARSSKAAALTPGVIVRVADKHVEALKDLFANTKEMQRLKVLQVVGSKRVAVVTEGGTRTILKVGEVTPVVTEKSDKAAE